MTHFCNLIAYKLLIFVNCLQKLSNFRSIYHRNSRVIDHLEIGIAMQFLCSVTPLTVGLIDANMRQDTPNDANWRQQAKMRQQKRTKMRQQND